MLIVVAITSIKTGVYELSTAVPSSAIGSQYFCRKTAKKLIRREVSDVSIFPQKVIDALNSKTRIDFTKSKEYKEHNVV